jgi:hypothetical protein
MVHIVVSRDRPIERTQIKEDVDDAVFDIVEKFFYDGQYDETSKAVHSWMEVKGSNWLSHSLQRLHAACCHLQVGTSRIGHRVCNQHGLNASKALSMDLVKILSGEQLNFIFLPHQVLMLSLDMFAEIDTGEADRWCKGKV